MTTGLHAMMLTNGTSPSAKPIELAIPLPHAPGSRIHMHLTILTTTIVLFVTSSGLDSSSASPASMGSLVYAMPDVRI